MSKLFVFGSQFCRANNEEDMVSPKAVLKSSNQVFGQIVAEGMGKKLINHIADNTTNDMIWNNLSTMVRTGEVKPNDYVIVQYNSIYQQSFLSTERSNDYNHSSPEERKNFDMREDYAIDYDVGVYKAIFTHWYPDSHSKQLRRSDRELHEAFQEATWDGRDCLIHYQNVFFNRHYVFKNAMQNAGIKVVYLWKFSELNPLTLTFMDELTQDCNNSIDIDRWLDQLPMKQRKIAVEGNRLTKSGHVDLATTIYKFIFSNGNFDK